MEHFLKLPPELTSTVQWAFGALVILLLSTKSLKLLQGHEWQNIFALLRRALAIAGPAVADAMRSPIRHPRLEFVLTTLFSAISYSQALVLLALVLATGLRVAMHATLPPWNFMEILLTISVIVAVAAMAFAEAERARQRAHGLLKEW